MREVFEASSYIKLIGSDGEVAWIIFLNGHWNVRILSWRELNF